MGVVTSTPTPSWTRSLAGIAAAATLLLAACGGSDDAADTDVAVAETAEGESVAIVETAPVTVTGEPLPEYGDPANDPAVGMMAPVLSGASFAGTPVTIGGPSDQLTFVVFLAHWCPACNAEIPELVDLAEAGDFPDGIDVVAVSTAAAEDRDNYPPSDWFAAEDWPFPVLADSPEVEALIARSSAEPTR
jgi:thiol-disulfide isomerase/thioredoxin